MPGWFPQFLSGHHIERGWRALALLLVLASLLELAATRHYLAAHPSKFISCHE